MIEVDISNIWGQVSLPHLLAMEKDVFAAHAALTPDTEEGSDQLGWLELPTRQSADEIQKILSAARQIRSGSDVCVVVGIGGSCLGAQAAIELLLGPNYNIGKTKGSGDPMLFFAGKDLSNRHWNELLRLLEGKDFSVIVISKSGATLEPAIAFRSLRWMLERKYGTDVAKKRIYAITDPIDGALRRMVEEEGWESFPIPRDVGGRFSVLSPAGLLPMAVAGIDIEELLAGAAAAKETYDLRSFENPVWLYAAVRNLMYRSGKKIEIFASQDPGFRMFGNWWQHLFAESEGKNGKGLFPVPAQFTADPHSLGQLIQQGERNLFETMVRFDPPDNFHTVGADYKNLDGLNYLAGKALDNVDEAAWAGTLAAHVDGGVPVITMNCGDLDAQKVGELIYFLELSCAISAYVLGVDPFHQPGVVQYKRNMFQLLGKPGYEM